MFPPPPPSLNLSSSTLNCEEIKEKHRLGNIREQKMKPMYELNPFATEFSFANIDKCDQERTLNAKETISSCRSIINDLIDKSLQSMDAIERASKYTFSSSSSS